MKYIEQKIEDLEKRISDIELKLKASKPVEWSDVIYSPSVNLMSHPDLDTAFPPYPEVIGSWNQN
jgi:hypothetical protein